MIPFFPVPGGALAANTQMLRDNGLMDKYPEVIAAMGEAVKKGGFGTSVTPVSRFYFQQAFNNVMYGPRKKIAEGYGKMVLGYLGRTPVPADADVIRIASEQLNLPPTTDHLTAIEEDRKRNLPAARHPPPLRKPTTSASMAANSGSSLMATTLWSRDVHGCASRVRSSVRRVGFFRVSSGLWKSRQ